MYYPLDIIKTVRDIAFYVIKPKKQLVFILSSMRSGSTLLKALLGQAADVSHLAEVKYGKFGNSFFPVYRQAYALSQEKILVVKKPAALNLNSNHFSINHKDVKIIILIRSPIDVVSSIKRSASSSEYFLRKTHMYETPQLYDYWYITYKDILTDISSLGSKAYILFYENLVRNPVPKTEELFNYIGSKQKRGVSEYSVPDSGNWKWGTDDGGELIALKSVQSNTGNRPQDSESLGHALAKEGLPSHLREGIVDLWQSYITLKTGTVD